MENTVSASKTLRLATVKQIPSIPGYECFSESALRHLIFQAEDRYASNGDIIEGNGLSSAILRMGRRLLIDLDAFDTWIEQHRMPASSSSNSKS